MWLFAPIYFLWSEVKVAQSCPTLCLTHGLYNPRNSPGQNTGVGSLSLLQGIFSTQGLNPGLPHCSWILYQLNHKGSPRILEWVAYLFSNGSSWPRNQTGVSCIAGGFFTSWAIREAQGSHRYWEFYKVVHYPLLVTLSTLRLMATASGFKGSLSPTAVLLLPSCVVGCWNLPILRHLDIA